MPNFLSSLKRRVPVSSRSFHAFEEAQYRLTKENARLLDNVARQLDDRSRTLNEKLDAVNARLAATNQRFDQVESELADTRRQQKADETKADLRFWSTYGSGKGTAEDKRRFFHSLPQATGDLRLLQKTLAKLLSDFADLCAENDITNWWLIGGTLLGAQRHNGFIPWDDDMDIGIMREDLTRLMKIVEKSNQFRITVIWDRIAYCRQVRLRPRQDNVPGFIDLFIFDWCAEASDKAYSRNLKARRTTIDILNGMDTELKDWRDNVYMRPNTPSGRAIAGVFDAQLDALRNEGVVCDKDEAAGVMRSFDNCDEPNGFAWITPTGMMFPETTLEFEGRSYPVPAQYMYFLEHSYTDIYELPNDIGQHFEHVSLKDIARPNTRRAILQYIGENDEG